MPDNEYRGYITVRLTPSEIGDFYLNMKTNPLGCLTNEYMILESTESPDPIEAFRWDGSSMVRVPFKTIRSRYFGNVKPKNIHQQLAVDMLYNNDITVKMLTGRYGTGKDYLMCAAAIEQLDKGKIDKIVYVRNNIEVRDSRPIGFLPGTNDEKLLPYAMVLADKLGGKDALEILIGQGRIELIHLGFIRGRDIKNSIVYCSEAENMTKEHIQLLLGRIGDGSSLWLNGDARQTDLSTLKQNSGMKLALDRLKGHPRFGYVELQKTERSETAAMADLLD